MPELSSKLLHEAMDVLASLFQEKHVSIYHSTAKNIMKQLSFSQTQSAQGGDTHVQSSEGIDPASSSCSLSQPTKELSYPSNSNQPESETSSANNKRGFQMMNNIKRSHSTSSGSPALKLKPQKDIFSALKNINIDKMKAGSSSEVSHTQQEKVKKARLDCLICATPPTNPLINECGHIACEECWYVGRCYKLLILVKI